MFSIIKIHLKKVKMSKIYCIKCKKSKISYICYKTLLLSSISNKCGSEEEKIYIKKESIKIFKILGFINNIEKYQNI